MAPAANMWTQTMNNAIEPISCPSPTFENLLEEIEGRGWYIYTLQNEPGHPSPWTCSLRYESGTDSLIAYGQGLSFSLALQMAINSFEQAERYVPKPVIEAKNVIPDVMELLRAKLQPKSTIIRRI